MGRILSRAGCISVSPFETEVCHALKKQMEGRGWGGGRSEGVACGKTALSGHARAVWEELLRAFLGNM